MNIITLGADGRPVVPSEDELREMSISNLATLAYEDWSERGKGIYFGAKPYLNAMLAMDAITDKYGLDDGDSIVTYFLSNANTWRGEMARAIKAELKRRRKEAVGY